jgi:hypothetical protein
VGPERRQQRPSGFKDSFSVSFGGANGKEHRHDFEVVRQGFIAANCANGVSEFTVVDSKVLVVGNKFL